MIALLLLSHAFADCPADPLGVALEATTQMEAAFVALDDEAFKAAQGRLDDAIPCIREPLTAPDAASIHRGRALGAFFAGDNVATARGLTSVRVLTPNWTPPTSYMPPGHPLREIWNLTAAEDTSVPAPAAPPGGWRIDGRARAEVPASRSFVAQGMGAGGEVLSTSWALRPADLAPWDGPVEPRKVNKGLRYGGSGVAVALLGVGAASLAMSSSAAGEVAEVPREEVVATGRKANTLAGVGAGSCAAGVAIGVASWAVSF